MDLQLIMDFIKNFGFPIAVACWALWRLDKNWAKGETIQSAIEGIEERLDDIEAMIVKNTEILTELAISIKILQGILQSGGDRAK